MDHRTDCELAAAVRLCREPAAVTELFERHWQAAWRASLAVTLDPSTAEDIAQEAFLAAMEGIDSFDARRPFQPWLVRIAVNRALNHKRSARRWTALHFDLKAVEPQGALVNDPALEAALRTLPSARRHVIVLHYFLGFSTDEIAQLLHRPVGTVYSQLARGRTQLRRLVEAGNDESRTAPSGGRPGDGHAHRGHA